MRGVKFTNSVEVNVSAIVETYPILIFVDGLAQMVDAGLADFPISLFEEYYIFYGAYHDEVDIA